jgi:hypothetical protein
MITVTNLIAAPGTTRTPGVTVTVTRDRHGAPESPAPGPVGPAGGPGRQPEWRLGLRNLNLIQPWQATQLPQAEPPLNLPGPPEIEPWRPPDGARTGPANAGLRRRLRASDNSADPPAAKAAAAAVTRCQCSQELRIYIFNHLTRKLYMMARSNQALLSEAEPISDSESSTPSRTRISQPPGGSDSVRLRVRVRRSESESESESRSQSASVLEA